MPAPSNDNFANAIEIFGPGTVTPVDVTDATVEVSEPVGSNPGNAYQTIWYKWTAPSNDVVAFSTAGSYDGVDPENGVDTTLAIWTGVSLGTLVEETSNDDAGIGSTSVCILTPSMGTTYYIQAGMYSDGTPGVMYLSLLPAPANDDIENAEVLTGMNGSVDGYTIASTEDTPDDILVEQQGTWNSVWYKIELPPGWNDTWKFVWNLSADEFTMAMLFSMYPPFVFPPTTYGETSTWDIIFDGGSGNTITIDPVPDDNAIYIGVGNFGGDISNFTITWSFVIPPLIPAPTLDVDNGWFIDSMDHDFNVYQVYNPENLHFTKRIRAVEDADWEVSDSAIDTADQPVVFRNVDTDEDAFKPWKHMYRLRLMEEGVETKIMAGPITLTNMAKGRDFIKVGGKDWMHYFERRGIPFNPLASPNGPFSVTNTFGPTSPPPTGLSYQEAARDVALIVKDILEFVMAQSFSLPISNSLSAIGITSNFALSLGDTSKLLAIFDGIAEIWPGFDYRISYDREFVMWTPFRFGDPDTTADDGPDGDNIAYAFGDYYGHPVVNVEYTNTGPQATHLFGLGAGLGSTQLGKALGASDIQEGYWRIDDDVNLGDQAKTQEILNNRTRKEFIFRAQEVHEIELTVDPQTVPDFWNVIRPGFAIWLREDLIQHEINSAQRVVSMELIKNNENDQQVKLGLNQIYNTSTHYGVDQA